MSRANVHEAARRAAPPVERLAEALCDVGLEVVPTALPALETEGAKEA